MYYTCVLAPHRDVWEERNSPHFPCGKINTVAILLSAVLMLLCLFAGGAADSVVDPFLTNRGRQLCCPRDTVPQQEKEVTNELLHHAVSSGRSLLGSNIKRLFLLLFHSPCFPFSCQTTM